MKWHNKDKTVGVEINAIEFFRFLKGINTEEPNCKSYYYYPDSIEISSWGCSKTIYGADARELHQFILENEQ